jgi:predicted peroxiredoxin
MNKLFCVLLFLSVYFLGCQNESADDESPVVKDGVFVHISHGSDDVHRVLMGLQMAMLMAEDKDVLVYFDISGIEVILKESKDLIYSHFPSSHTQIQNLLAKNVTLVACPGCLKAAGKSPEDVMPGIKIADKETFFNFTAGRILTIDY